MSSTRNLARLPGFRDFPPEEMALRNHLFDAWRRVSRRYGFQEYDGPPLEELELYTRKSGDEIVRQLYAFQDKGGREVALRPEMTPSLARILGERSRSMAKPVRWFSIPQLFRYERQQRGRLREHFQWNVDVLGADGAEADAEILAVALDSLRELGLGSEHVRARISDRRLLAALLGSVGVPTERLDAAYAIVDKVEREPRERISERLAEAGFAPATAEGVLDLFDRTGLEDVEERFGREPEVAGPLSAVREVVAILGDLGLGQFVEFDLTIVRGLAYYTGTVFEIFDRGGEHRAICGGGRYDRLLELVGGEALPAAGFGMGDVVLADLLAEHGLAPSFDRSVDCFIVVIGPEQASLARGLAATLRAEGRSVVYGLRRQSVRKQFSAAASEGARETLILGPEEAERGVVVVRDMASGEERERELPPIPGATGDASARSRGS